VKSIRRDWQLDADLVVLSACRTALGRNLGGEGLLGFAQAFLQKGARSVVLSRWKVDDAATALLMLRFYENLLGKRKELAQPLGRAEALQEAKVWLRTLPRKEVETLVASLTHGEIRGTLGPAPKRKLPAKAQVPAGDRPYAHPYYWAAFVLVGDPE
jgi:CHAT domain-containing protein